ncbi:MAG: hypothetical protein AB1521_13580 [Bacteroidota bacterium]
MKISLQKKGRIYYPIIIKIGHILSLLLCVMIFLLAPRISKEKKEIPYFPEPLITVLDIPRTDQSSSSSMPRPAVPIISSLFEPLDEPEPLGDFEIKESSKEQASLPGSKQTASDKKGIYEATSFPFVPRQIVEVIPEKVDDAEGSLKLRLLISREGIVKTHGVLSNTLNNKKVYQNVIDAVYKSRWQPITFEGEKVEYWIEKTYTFD